MDYVALHYIPLKSGLATPGEILKDLPEDVIPRLLEKGAIREIAPVSAAEETDDGPEEEAGEAEQADVTEETDDAEAAEEIGIDALEAIGEAEPEAKPAKKTRKSRKGAEA